MRNAKQITRLHHASCILAIVCTAILFCACATVTDLEHRGAHPQARPGGTQAIASDNFPTVDWDAWLDINPDIIGWITIPDASIDLPIVQACKDDPQFYLTHDVYRNLNFTGCPYLDAECGASGGLLKCRNSIVLGHNMGWNRDMFANLERYPDVAFARKHRTVLLQTPSERIRMRVMAANVVPGSSTIKRVEFADDLDFSTWWTDRFNESAMRFAEDKPTDSRLLTLCTCSYNYWSDERTLVYCMRER